MTAVNAAAARRFQRTGINRKGAPMPTFRRTVRVLSAVLVLLLAGNAPASAAGCTAAENDQFIALSNRSEKNFARCMRVLKSRSLSIEQACSSCDAYYRDVMRMDQWITRHGACARHLGNGLDSLGHDFMKTHRKMCG